MTLTRDLANRTEATNGKASLVKGKGLVVHGVFAFLVFHFVTKSSPCIKEVKPKFIIPIIDLSQLFISHIHFSGTMLWFKLKVFFPRVVPLCSSCHSMWLKCERWASIPMTFQTFQFTVLKWTLSTWSNLTLKVKPEVWHALSYGSPKWFL